MRPMRNLLDNERLVAVVGALTAAVALIGTIADLLGAKTERWLLFALLALFVLTGTIALVMFFRMAANHPRSLTVALIGPSGAGKTVYLTALFKQMELTSVSRLVFRPSGLSTVETVNTLYLLMTQQGRWPDSTPADPRLRFEAVVSLGAGIFRRRYRIQISDYGGEYLGRFDTPSNGWLHRSSLFSEIGSADALLIMVDCERLLQTTGQQGADPVAVVEHKLRAAIQVLIQSQGSDPTKPLRIPVGLIISKSDLLRQGTMASDESKREVLGRLKNLEVFCKENCRYFRYFFVSSLGVTPTMDSQGRPIPPRQIRPSGVVEPIRWILGV